MSQPAESRWEGFARELVAAGREPPRSVDSGRLRRLYLLDHLPQLLAALVGTGFGTFFVVAGLVDGDGAVAGIGLGTLALAGIVVAALWRELTRVNNALVRQPVAHATVAQLPDRIEGPPEHGDLVEVRIRAAHPELGEVDEPVMLAAGRVTGLTPGSPLEVLLEPERPRVLLVL